MKKPCYIQIEKQFPGYAGPGMMEASYEQRRNILEEILGRRIEVTPKILSKKHNPDDGFMSLCFGTDWLKSEAMQKELESYAQLNQWKVSYLEEDNREFMMNGNGNNGSSK